MSVSGEPNVATDPVLIPFGTLTIELGDRDGAVTLDLVDGPDYEQPIVTQQPCAQVGFGIVAEVGSDVLPSAGNLLTLNPIVKGVTSAPGDTVQLPDDALGVNSGENCGSPAGLIGPKDIELLEISLGPFFEQFRSDPAEPSVFASSAALVIDKKFRNDGNLTVGYDGGPQGDPISIQVGGETVVPPSPGTFTSVTIGSTSAKESRGLSVAGMTSFDLVARSGDFDVAVDCGEQVPVAGEPGDIATDATYLRLDNKINPESCQQVGVRVQIQTAAESGDGEARVFWNNSFAAVNTGDEQTVQAYFTIIWAPAGTADLDRVIDYDGDAGPGTASSMLWCDGYDEGGTPVLPAYSGGGAIDVDPVPDDGVVDLRAPWCLVEDHRELAFDGSGQVVQTQVLYGSGDPWAR